MALWVELQKFRSRFRHWGINADILQKSQKNGMPLYTKEEADRFFNWEAMATALWDCQERVVVNYMENSEAITGAYNASLLDRLKSELKDNVPNDSLQL